jgi:uncharacterized protein YndB with AHSA1/START domain
MFRWLFGGKRASGGESGGDSEVAVFTQHVAIPVDQAFSVFVDKIGAWWPRDLTWAGERLAQFGIDAKLNGACYEIDADGGRAIWGTVLSVQRPSHIVIAWQMRADRTPEDSADHSSRVDVRFVADEGGGTTVTIVHRDFRRHGDGWQGYRTKMAGKAGWPRLIGLYAAAAGRG